MTSRDFVRCIGFVFFLSVSGEISCIFCMCIIERLRGINSFLFPHCYFRRRRGEMSKRWRDLRVANRKIFLLPLGPVGSALLALMRWLVHEFLTSPQSLD